MATFVMRDIPTEAELLIGRGCPPILAVRIVSTPQIEAVHPKAAADDGSRPGREIAEGVERAFCQVVEMLGHEWLGHEWLGQDGAL